MNDTISRVFLHVGDSAAVDRDWTVVILGFYVEETSESVDDIVDVEGSSVKDIVIVAVEGSSVDDIFAVEGSSIEYIVTVEGTSVDGIVAIDALLGGDVVVEAIVVVGVVDCLWCCW